MGPCGDFPISVMELNPTAPMIPRMDKFLRWTLELVPSVPVLTGESSQLCKRGQTMDELFWFRTIPEWKYSE